MNDSIDQRRKGMDAKMHHDDEMRFKVRSRRDKLLGLWVAEQLGMTQEQAQTYAKTVVISDLEEPGDEDVIRKVLADLNAKGLTVTREAIVEQMQQLEPVARQQLLEQD